MDRHKPDPRIDLLLAVHGGKIEAVAAAVGIAPSTAWRWREGLVEPSARKLREVDAALAKIGAKQALDELELVARSEEDEDA